MALALSRFDNGKENQLNFKSWIFYLLQSNLRRLAWQGLLRHGSLLFFYYFLQLI